MGDDTQVKGQESGSVEFEELSDHELELVAGGKGKNGEFQSGHRDPSNES